MKKILICLLIACIGVVIYKKVACEVGAEVWMNNEVNGKIEALEFVTKSTFERCKNLKKVYLPERLSDLPAYVFSECTSLDTLYIPFPAASK